MLSLYLASERPFPIKLQPVPNEDHGDVLLVISYAFSSLIQVNSHPLLSSLKLANVRVVFVFSMLISMFCWLRGSLIFNDEASNNELDL